MGLFSGRGLLSMASRLQFFRHIKHVNRSTVAAVKPAQGFLDSLPYSPGQKLHGYTVQKVVPVPELYLTAVYLEHDKTGAQHLHVARDDANNVFGVAFRTTPMDSTGVPHILEHTALCGSEKFPVRDPFFKMLNRSLSTFMNAFTASDWTMYPFSTQNPQDYKNLMSVYLDATFFPRLREDDFRQEGWRLEHENPHDTNTPIIFKGVVYNEMKGVFSNSQHLFAQKVQNLLMPSHTYSVVSGGDPHHIPDLTWDQLRNFHATHYHPSNSRFYTYGNLPLEKSLEFINHHALEKFERLNTDTSVPPEKRWEQPKEISIKCNSDPMAPDPNKQTTIAVNYLLNDISDEVEASTLSILGSLLVSGEKSPFSQALLEANIGSDFSPVIGYDGNTREASFSVGLQGIHDDDVDRVKNIIQDTLEKVAREGFEQERIDAILHKIELSMKHQYEKFGLYLGVSMLPAWTHGADAIKLLQVNRMVDHLKQNLKENPSYLQDKVKQYFLDNPHRLTVMMNPDESFDEQRQIREEEKLSSLVSPLTDSDKKEIYEAGLRLEETQNKTEDLSCLPTLKVEDIEKTVTPVATNTIYTEEVPIQICEQPTNSVTYFHAVSSLNDLPEHLKPYVPLFCTVVTRMGAGGMDFKEFSQQVDLRTGGLSSGCHIVDHHTENNTFEQGVLFSSFCLDQNIDYMFNLWTDIFRSLDLSDSNRLLTLIMMSAAELANSLADAGHSYAIGHAASSLTPTAKLKDMMSGMVQVSVMKGIAEMTDHSQVVKHLQDIASHLLNRDHIRCAINATPETLPVACDKLGTFIKCLDKPGRQQCLQQHTNDSQYLLSLARPTFSCHSSLRILAKLMSSKFLHREIREKGGAYGGGASGLQPSVFTFFSYRDPNSMKTLEAFDKAVDWAVEGKFSSQDIDEAKLSVFSQVDMPIPPGDRGLRLFLTGIDDNMRQRHREQLFKVSKDSLIDVANSLRILAKLMSSKFLHREIREKGGAYGGGASGLQPSVFTFFSYRDPNSMKTLEAFDKAVDWAVEGKFSSQDIDEAKLSVFSQVDMPIPPGDRGLRLFLTGIDDNMRQRHREQLFKVSKDSLIDVANRYLTLDRRVSSVSFLGPENKVTCNSKEWTIKTAE